jgi:nitrite reductase/ring-hydroxylating ferredoxin subunit
MLILFIITFFMRKNEGYSHIQLALIELAALIIMMIAGWLGGTLVYRNQIGVDHRYANAGKWKEAFIKNESGRIKVADAGELKLNAMKLLHLKQKRVVLARTEKGYVAFDDRCPHRGASLADGTLACGIVQCPWHGSQFSVQIGGLDAGPAEKGISTYNVVETGGSIFIEL